MDHRQVLESLPLPLARGFRRHRNAGETREAHDAAYYLFEVYLKYTAAGAIAEYLAGSERDHKVNAVLKGLARPSLGEWLRFLKECVRFLVRSEGGAPDPAVRAVSDLLERRESRWGKVLELSNALRAFHGKSGEKEGASLEQVLSEVVSYRNRVLGHGAPLAAEHYERFGGLFARAFGELLDFSPFLTARRLVAFDSPCSRSSVRARRGTNIEPRAGLQVMPDYYDPADGSGLAASTGLVPTPGRPDANPGGVPTWLAHEDVDDTIDFTDVYGTPTDNVMCYAAAYIHVTEDATVDIGLASDDSIQVLVDGVEVHLNNIPRPAGARNEVQDTVMGVDLAVGCHLLIVKVFEGSVAHAFRLRFQEPVTAEPALPGRIRLAPCGEDLPAFLRGDADSSGEVDLTDAIRVLNVLFLGIGAIVCADAADADDSGVVDLTDAIRILNVLFIGLGTIPAPGLESCGPDPTDDVLTACAGESC